MSRDLKTLLSFVGFDNGMTSVTNRVSKAFDPLLSKARILSTVFNDATKNSEKFGKTMDKVGGGFKAVGKTMSLYVTAPLLAMGGLAIKAGMDFDTAMEGLQIRSGLTADQLQEVSKGLDSIVTGSKFTSTQAVGALETLMKSNFSLKDSFAVLPSVINLATAEEMDFGEAAKVTAGILRGYNLKISDTGRVSDLMARTVNVANVDLLQLSEAFKEVGPLASTAGLSLEETTGILSQFALKNVQGAEAGSLLRKAIGKIIAPSTQAANILGGVLHIKKSDVMDSTGHLKSFAGFLDILKKKGATTEQIIEIFGQRMGPQLAPLIQDSSGSLQEFIDKISGPNSVGAAAKTAAIRLEGPADSIERMHAAFTNFSKSLGESGLLDVFTGIVNKVTDLLIWMKQLNPTILRVAIVVGAVVAVVGPLLVLFGTFLTMLPSMVIGFTLVSSAIGLISAPLLAAAPIVLGIIAAIGALGYVAYRLHKDWDVLGPKFKAIWDNIKSIFDTGVSGVLEAINLIMNPFGGLVGLLGKKLFGGSTPQLGQPDGKGQAVQTQAAANQNQVRTNNASVSVDFSNMPRGTQVRQNGTDDILNLGLGFGGALE